MQKLFLLFALEMAMAAAQNGKTLTLTRSTTTTTSKSTTTTTSTKPTTTTTTTTTSSASCATASHDAAFDDLTATVPAVPLVLPIPYMELYYQGFGYIGVVKSNTLSGVVPQSGNNYAFASVTSTTTGGSAQLTVNYTGSAVKSFTLSSFYYGCTTNQLNGATDLPTQCNIAITPFISGDNTAQGVALPGLYLSYNPSTSTGPAQMAEGIFNSYFENIQYILIQYTLPGGLAALATDLAFLIDNVEYYTCS